MNKTETNTELLSEEERLETERALRRTAQRRRKQYESQRRRKRSIIAVCVLCILILILLCFLVVTIMFGHHEATENVASMDKSAVSTGTEDGENGPEVIENEFASVYYYEEENLERYEAYKAQNPDMDIDEIIWRVNSYLDKPWYEYDISVDSYDDPYIIVNKYYTVPEGYRPPDLVNVDGYQMREETGEAYREMKAAAAKEGMRIMVVSAYRSVEYQRGLYNRYLSNDSRANVDRYSARAGHSEHHTGMALDLFGSKDGLRNFINTPEGPWVRDNCYKYGFIVRYTAETEGITGYEDEPWHIRYVGKEVSMDMKEKGITTFEEYHVKYIEHTPPED